MMLDPVRIFATALYLASMIIALFCALYVSLIIVPLFLLVLTFLVFHLSFFMLDLNSTHLDGNEQVHNKLLTLLAIILEFGALTW